MERMIPKGLEPEAVLEIFEEISRIPRASRHEEEISNWLVRFAERYNLDCLQDEMGNVLIRKPGTPGKEDHPGVILQSHMDMVCEKVPGSNHDFTKDPIQITVEGDKITAKETTLGADNGLGLSLSLALLTLEDAPHPPLEVLVTVDEELGLTGAEKFDASQLTGKHFINTDSIEENVFPVGSAGGPTVSADIPVEWTSPAEGALPYCLRIDGLLGGHSANDINRGRGNANKLLFRLLDALERKGDYELSSVKGGMAGNAIPREAEAILMVPSENLEILREEVKRYYDIYKAEYRVGDPDVNVIFEPYEETVSKVFARKTMDSVIDFGVFCENGILRMFQDIEGVVESSNNVGCVTTDEEKVTFVFVTRSSLESIYQTMVLNIDRLARNVGGSSHKDYDCLEWPYEPESEIRDLFVEVYQELFDKEAYGIPVHSGLECGIIAKNMGRKVDMISVGAKTGNLHKPGEWFSISSTQRYWKLLQEVLKRL